MNKLNENDFNLLINDLCNAMDVAGIKKEQQAIVVKELNNKRALNDFKDLAVELFTAAFLKKK